MRRRHRTRKVDENEAVEIVAIERMIRNERQEGGEKAGHGVNSSRMTDEQNTIKRTLDQF